MVFRSPLQGHIIRTKEFTTHAIKMKLISFLLLLFVGSVFSTSWLDLWFPRESSYLWFPRESSISRRNGSYRQYREGRNGKERWKQICRTINADPYAYPGRVPYPAALVCPW